MTSSLSASALVIQQFLTYNQTMRFLAAITMLIVALTVVQPVAGQSFTPDWGVGYIAYLKSDYATALRHWRPLAKLGNNYAQHWLGRMYHDGKGVVQDLVMAYVWLSVSAPNSNPYNNTKRDRDNVLAGLNASERKLALELSKRCFKKPARCPEHSDD